MYALTGFLMTNSRPNGLARRSRNLKRLRIPNRCTLWVHDRDRKQPRIGCERISHLLAGSIWRERHDMRRELSGRMGGGQ